MDYKYKWEKTPYTDSKVIRLFRNFCADEFSNEYVYKNGPYFKEWSINGVIDFVNEHGTAEQKEALHSIYMKALDKEIIYPFASTLHKFMRKYDKEWVKNTLNRNYKISEEEARKYQLKLKEEEEVR